MSDYWQSRNASELRKKRIRACLEEVYTSKELTDSMRQNFHLMKALGQHSRVFPSQRIEKLLSFNRRLHEEPKITEELSKWDLELENKLVQIPARILPNEKIIFGHEKIWEGGAKPHDWTSAFPSQAMFSSVRLADWVIITVKRFRQDTVYALQNLMKAASGIRFPIAQPEIIDLYDDRAQSYTEAIENLMSRKNPQLILCVVPNNRADRYSAIKKKCTIDRPVPTQVSIINTFKKNLSISTKIAIQLNCKIGGAPWSVEIPVGGMMIVGIDVCRDTSKKGRDFGALVASMDKSCTRYFSAVSARTVGEELSNDLALNLVKALHKYKEFNKALPTRVIIYRDGVSEGQIPFIIEHEVSNMKKKLEEAYGKPGEPKMAYILVTKKINTRLFFNKSNPLPGSIVDDVITHPAKFDFFLVSQLVNQGTVSPTYYSVLSSNVGFPAEKIQILTYKLCHGYYNWPGPIRVPAPCQYSQKLACLVSQAIHSQPSAFLDTFLHFL